MSRTLIQKSQLDPLNIVDSDVAAGAAISTSKLADGTNFLKRDGSIALIANFNAGGFSVNNLAAPVNPNDAVRLVDLNNVSVGLDFKNAVRAAATTNITLSGLQTVDSVSLNANDRVLVMGQTTASANGIYVASTGAWARSSDLSTTVSSGTFCFVEEGATYASTGWVLQTPNPITLGTTNLTFVQFSGAGEITAGNGITKTGNTLSVSSVSASRIVVGAGGIDLATTGVTAGSYTKFTVDAYGRITAATSPTTLAGYGITDAQSANVELTGISALSTLGLLVRTATGTYTTRALAVSARLSLSNVDGTAGNPTFDLATVGTAGTYTKVTTDAYGRVIGSATLAFADISDASIASPANGQILQYNSATSKWQNATLGSVITTSAIFRETPSGAINGTNTIFTLANTPITGTEMVYYNGVLQDAGSGNDYTISGGTITFTFTPQTGDKIRVSYNK